MLALWIGVGSTVASNPNNNSDISPVSTIENSSSEQETEKKAAEEAKAKQEAEKKAAEQAAKATNPPPPSAPNSNSVTIYITPTGKRYHYDSKCNGGTYNESTLDKAKELGLTPCSKCVA